MSRDPIHDEIVGMFRALGSDPDRAHLLPESGYHTFSMETVTDNQGHRRVRRVSDPVRDSEHRHEVELLRKLTPEQRKAYKELSNE